MWRFGALAVVLCAWEVCRAQGLVNLVQPRISSNAPQEMTYGTRQWVVFDGDTSTSFQLVKALQPSGVQLTWPFRRPIRPIAYRIILAADVEPEKYPSSWEVRRNNDVVDNPVGAVFTNGVYEGTLPGEVDMFYFSIKAFNKGKVDIAEIELLGTREALDALWTPGSYPCSQRTAVITDENGPTDVFVKTSAGIKSRATGRAKGIFTAQGDFASFDFTKAMFFTVYLPETPMVREVIIHTLSAKEGAVLLGNRCEPNCDKYGSKGWVRLAKGSYDNREMVVRIFVENPGEYKAYRVKFPHRNRRSSISFGGIYFLGCRT